jgi:hypothetical protein
MAEPSADDYPYLRAWDRMMMSSSYWRRENLERARHENAPHDAIYKSHEGRWCTYQEIQNPSTKILIDKLLDTSEAP